MLDSRRTYLQPVFENDNAVSTVFPELQHQNPAKLLDQCPSASGLVAPKKSDTDLQIAVIEVAFSLQSFPTEVLA